MSYDLLMSSSSSTESSPVQSKSRVDAEPTLLATEPVLLATVPAQLATSTRIWCTLVMIKESYACGAVALAHAMRKLKTKYPMWCMVGPGISVECEQWLAKWYDKIVKVPFIEHEVIDMKSKKQREIYGSWISKSFTKCHIFNPDTFPVEKLIFLDADSLPVENIDDLFEIQAPALTYSSPWVAPYAAKKAIMSNNPYGEMKHGSIVAPSKIRNGFSSILGIANMMMISPSVEQWNTFNKHLNNEPKYGYAGCISGFDEQIVSETLLSVGAPIRHIHQQYNWIVGKDKWLRKGQKPKLFQWYNEKPWTQKRGEWPDLIAWYAIWDEVVAADPTAAGFFPTTV